MRKEVYIRTRLFADEGMILTDGKDYGSKINLAVGADETAWQEITKQEYEEIMEERAKNEEVYSQTEY